MSEILTEKEVVTPLEVFVHMQLLTRDDLEGWRRGRIPYLERVIHCNLAKASRILRILRFHAHDLNLKPSSTVYLRKAAGKKLPLRFSKTGDPKLEAAYACHFVAPDKRKNANEGE